MSVFSFLVKNTATKESNEIINQTQSSVATPVNLEWFADEYEGQLSVDVYQNKDSLVVRSTIAGVRLEDLDIVLNNDVITIRGKRYQQEEINPDDYFYQECYWGGFSRSIVLPMEVDPAGVKANLENGVLTVTLPKLQKQAVEIKVEEITKNKYGE